ncbi:endonuclease domain-containing 1 protein-like [Labeo rohita]|uniref:endonuclease domain-containing 1 protein-like n=1 Tax=Labeo rohita TaxID=84645 RepID=UPI0021E2C51E|nr:endonuclease domain-containing 1 protein-like [Labeo rohita]
MQLFFFTVLLVLGFPFIMTEVVDSFSQCSGFFFEGEPPKINDILERSISLDNDRYKLICQKYNGTKRYATLYDIKNKIPVFSAYTYTGGGQKKNKTRKWMIEPQLEMTDEMREPCVSQACTQDYTNQSNLSRGHLFPKSYAADKDTAKSTFTLTNAVPQIESFNSGSWSNMEKKVKNEMDSHCKKDNSMILAYVLTGAVPSQNKLMKEKVNIPSHMWTAFCCYNITSQKWVAQAHWAENIDESNGKCKTISEKSLKDLQDFLKINYKETILFKDQCLEMLNAHVSQPLEADSDDQQYDEEQSLLAFLISLPAKVWVGLRNYKYEFVWTLF